MDVAVLGGMGLESRERNESGGTSFSEQRWSPQEVVKVLGLDV